MLLERFTDYEIHQTDVEHNGVIYPIKVRVWNNGKQEIMITQELIDAGIILSKKSKDESPMLRSASLSNTDSNQGEELWLDTNAVEGYGAKITLNAKLGAMMIESKTTGGDYGYDGAYPSDMKVDAKNGVIESRNANGVAQLTSAGIFCNNAGTQAVAASLGISRRAAIVGLGYGTMNKDNWQNENFIAGVYGYSSNRGTAPAYGGFFQDLLISGMILKNRSIDDNSGTVYLSTSDSFVLGLTNSGVTKTVYLPNDGIIGRTIIVKQIGKGALRFYPRSGQYIYDDSTANDYYDNGEGWMAIFNFVRFNVNGVTRDVWAVSRCKY